jgi:PKD repeat protein
MSPKIDIDRMINSYKDRIIRLNQTCHEAINNTTQFGNKFIGSAIDPVVDPFVNFGKATVSQGYDNLTTVIILANGNGTIFPDPSIDGSFNLVWWNSTDYGDPSDDPNKEIVRCTARSGDIITIVRAQEGTVASTKNLMGKTYKAVLSVTAKVFTDLQNVPAKSLQSVTGAINISGATGPSIGQVLMATSPTAAMWQSLQQPTCFFVSIVCSPSYGIFPLTVAFNSTIIGGEFPYTYLWTFGDGGLSASPAPTHNYVANGTYSARLIVTDSLENSATSFTTITVLTGVGIVANGLGMSESMIVPDFLAGFNNTSANRNSPLLESITISDSLTGMNNTSAYGNSPFSESVAITDVLAGFYNASAYGSYPFDENITNDEFLRMISQISIPTTSTVSRTATVILTPTCYLYGTQTMCPILSWSSSNTGIATVSSTGVVTGIAIGTANITTSSGILSNTCVVTVTT